MREYGVYIPVTGLRLKESDTTGLEVLKNLVPKGEYWNTPDWPTLQWDDTYQIVRGWTQTFLCGSTKIYTINESTLALTAVHTVTPGGRWSLADFGGAYLLSNGVCTAYRRLTATGWTTGVITNPFFGTVCDHYKSRLIYGNLGTGFTNWVGWSDVNADDLAYLLAGTEPSAEIKARNTNHKQPMGFRGKVLAVLPMGSRMMVYGEDGIGALEPYQTAYQEVPIKGLPEGLGIYGRYSVAGKGDGHVFMGTDGYLWMIQPDMKAMRLGYDWLTQASEISYDPIEQDWWITTDTESYVLSKYGLGGPMSCRLYSLARFQNGTLYGTGIANPDSEYALTIWTNLLDMSDTGQKRITFVRCAADNVSEQKASAKIRFTRLASMRQIPWSPCSPEGAAFVNAAYIDGQIGYTAKTTGSARIRRIEVRYQSHDRRTIRGTRPMPTHEEQTGEDGAGSNYAPLG